MVKKLVLSLLVFTAILGTVSSGASAKWKEDKNHNVSWEESGIKAKGWKQIDGKWYNFDENGIMRKGWLQDGGNWYYLWSNGVMAKDTWLSNGGYWYYFDDNGKFVDGSVDVKNRQYYIAPGYIVPELK